MLDDLKSFFATSSVAEVGVGVTIGAAFAALIAAVTEAGRSVIAGDADFTGLTQAAIVLLSVALISLFGVVKPLMSLKEKMGRAQAAKVADAVQQVRDADSPPEVDSVVGAESTTVGGTDAPAAAAAASEGAPGTVDVAVGADVAAAAQPWTGAPDPAAGAGGSWPVAPQSDPLTLGGPELAAADGAAAVPATAYDPLFGPLPTVPSAEGAGSADQPEGTAGTSSAVDATAARQAPHAATTTKVCPYCAFDIPAVASRCGWCTSDLADLERGEDPVLVES